MTRRRKVAKRRPARRVAKSRKRAGRFTRFCGYNDPCASCSLVYKTFKTGYKYSEIWAMRWSYNEDSATWMYKRRGTILGLWHQIKKSMWAEHKEACFQELSAALEGVPF